MNEEVRNFDDKISKFLDKRFSKISREELHLIDSEVSNFVKQIYITESLPGARDILLNSRFGRNKASILHIAAKFGCVSCVKEIIEIAGTRDFINCKDADLFTPIHTAAKSGWSEIVEILIQNSCDPNPKTSEATRSWTPIHFAARWGHNEVVKILFNTGISKETKTIFGLTCLHIAAEHGHIDLVKYLLRAGLDKDATTEIENHVMTPLHYAAIGGYKDIIIELLKCGANVNAQTSGGFTALHFAANSDRVQAVEILLASGCNKNLKTSQDLTALEIAVTTNHPNVVLAILKYGADDIENALKIAKTKGCKESFDILENYQKSVKNIFHADHLKKIAENLTSQIRGFSSENLFDAKIILSDSIALNAYGVLSLAVKGGFLGIRKITLQDFASKNNLDDLSKALKTLGEIVSRFQQSQQEPQLL